MKHRLLSILMLLFPVLAIAGEDENFSVAKIPVALLKNADAVLRVEEQTFEIKSVKEAVQTSRYVITILNENGDHWAEFSESYDNLRSLGSIQGYLYDASGKQLKKTKSKDFQDMSAGSSINLIDDNRIKRHNFYHKSYPYTIEYSFEVKYKYTLFFPAWMPQGSDKLSVQKSTMKVICPKDYEFRFKAFNYDESPVISEEKNSRITVWSKSNMPAILLEPFQPMLHEVTTMVLFGPTEFQVGDYKGNMQSWEDFGKFIYALKKGRDVLPENVKQKVHELVDGVKDEREKIRILYEYMQQNTRYISIQLGIGGWQPFDAKFVASKSYGDCKALTNYMYSLLKEAGIHSSYAVVRAGEGSRYITEDFPSQQFNHVILCIPGEKDSIWLECTSQIEPTGYMGGFTGNRKALLTHENGGALVNTPRYGARENRQIRKVKAKLTSDGTLHIKADTRYYAMQQDHLYYLVNNLSNEKVKEHLNKQLDFATYDVDDFKYKQYKSTLPHIDESLDIRVSNFATITGKRLFLLPNVMTKSHMRLTEDKTRKYEVVLSSSFQLIDSIEIELPSGYEKEAGAGDVVIESKFGKYESSTKISGNTLFHYRSFERREGRFPASEYNSLVEFYDKIYTADRSRLVLVKDETSAPLKAF